MLEILESRRLLSAVRVDAAQVGSTIEGEFVEWASAELQQVPEPGQKFLVGLNPGSSVGSFRDAVDMQIQGLTLDFVHDGLLRVSVAHADDWSLFDDWVARGLVSYIEPDVELSLAVVPQDSGWSDLWGLHNDGATGGTVDSDIDAPEAWDITTGSTHVGVGVIDTGINYEHPDLYLNIWLNQRELPAGMLSTVVDTDFDGLITFYDLNANANAALVSDRNGSGYIDAGDLLTDSNWADGVDQDGNGYPDDLIGWDFANGDNDPMDDHNHGSHVAGTIGAIANNDAGVVGVTWKTQIAALKFLGQSGSGSLSHAVHAIHYATEIRAQGGVLRLTNNSWGGGGFSRSLEDAIAGAADQDMLFIAAAGNGGYDNDETPFYPASYDVDNVISVAAVDHADTLPDWSQWGATTVDLAAPGVDILSAVAGGGYGIYSGTSMATPHVAGAAALAWGRGLNATGDQMRSAIMASVDAVDGLAGMVASGGRLNARRMFDYLDLAPAVTLDLDRERYRDSGTLQITLSHPFVNADPQSPDSVYVNLSSSTETQPERVRLVETGNDTSIFQADVGLGSGTATVDGRLQVASGDQIKAEYQNADPDADSSNVIAVAQVDTEAPQIGDIAVTAASDSIAVDWKTNEPATAIVRYGSSPGSLNQQVELNTVGIVHRATLAGLQPDSNYYFTIHAVDRVGLTSASEVQSARTNERGSLLFVDDDLGMSTERYFIEALDQSTVSYEVWEVQTAGLPSADVLSRFSVVFWNTGPVYNAAGAGLTQSEQVILAEYLDAGGRLGIFGQDILWNGLSDDFRTDYLHIAGHIDDVNAVRHIGVDGNAISGGGDLMLSVPASYGANYSDAIAPDPLGNGLFRGAGHPGAFEYSAVSYSGDGFRTAFFGFAVEAVPLSSVNSFGRGALLRRVHAWLGDDSQTAPPPTGPIEFSIGDVRVAEAPFGGSVAEVTIQLNEPSATELELSYATQSITATPHVDYLPVAAGRLLIAPGQTNASLRFEILDDLVNERDETFAVHVSGQNLVSGNAAVTIIDNDPQPWASIGDAELVEGDSGMAPAEFVVRLSAPSGRSTSVTISTQSDSAVADVDFQALDGRLVTFAAGQTQQSIHVNVVGDLVPENDERFRLLIDASDGLQVADQIGIGTILNDDVSFADLKPVVLGPQKFSTDGIPEIVWSETLGAARYELWVNNLTTGETRVVHTQQLTRINYRAHELASDHVYRVWVRAIDHRGTLSQWSRHRDFAVVDPIVWNDDGTSFSGALPKWDWSALELADRYELWLQNLATGSDPVVYQTEAAESEFLASEPLGIGEYRAWVRGHNDRVGWMPWSEPLSFRIQMAPTWLAPVPGEQIMQPQFAWSEVVGAAAYELTLRNVSTGQDRVLHDAQLTATRFIPEHPLPDGNYLAWVRAIDASGRGSQWSVGVSFQIGDDLRIVGPSGLIGEARPVISWNAQTQADHYDIWIRSLTDMQSVFLRNERVAGESFTPDVDLPNGRYQVWVRAILSNGVATSWSDSVTFQVGASPEFAVAFSSNIPAVNWGRVAGGSQFELWCRNVSTGQDKVIHESALSGTHWQADVALPKGTYIFWMRTLDSEGQAGVWSDSLRVELPSAMFNGQVADRQDDAIFANRDAVSSNHAVQRPLMPDNPQMTSLLPAAHPVVESQIMRRAGSDRLLADRPVSRASAHVLWTNTVAVQELAEEIGADIVQNATVEIAAAERVNAVPFHRLPTMDDSRVLLPAAARMQHDRLFAVWNQVDWWRQ